MKNILETRSSGDSFKVYTHLIPDFNSLIKVFTIYCPDHKFGHFRNLSFGTIM